MTNVYLVKEVENLIVVLAQFGLLEKDTGNTPLDLSVVEVTDPKQIPVTHESNNISQV